MSVFKILKKEYRTSHADLLVHIMKLQHYWGNAMLFWFILKGCFLEFGKQNILICVLLENVKDEYPNSFSWSYVEKWKLTRSPTFLDLA